MRTICYDRDSLPAVRTHARTRQSRERVLTVIIVVIIISVAVAVVGGGDDAPARVVLTVVWLSPARTHILAFSLPRVTRLWMIGRGHF